MERKTFQCVRLEVVTKFSQLKVSATAYSDHFGVVKKQQNRLGCLQLENENNTSQKHSILQGNQGSGEILEARKSLVK
jgi:hypothetical protein